MAKNTLLVVDDEEMIRKLLKSAFEARGYDVVTAESAEKALELFEDETYWVVLSDLQLPGANGIELCGRIKSHYPMCIVLAMTGYVSAYELVACREAGFEDYFVKPINIKALGAEIDAAFRKIERWRSGRTAPKTAVGNNGGGT